MSEPAPSPVPSLSVVIPTYGRAERLLRCVRSVAAAVPANAEIIVSDDGSPDDTVARARAFAASEPRVRVLTSPNTGPAGARNRGWRAAKAAIVAFVDDDCTAMPGWGEAFLTALRAHPEWAGAEGSTEPEGEVPSLFFHSVRGGAGSYLTCNLALRRSALEAVGGLDERFPHPHGEDLDLCYRVVERVGEIGFAAQARVLHMVVPVDPLYPVRLAKLDASTYRLFALHPARFPAAWSTLKLPLVPKVDATHPPRFWQIASYIFLAKSARAYFAVRDSRTLRERLVGGAAHWLAVASSLGELRRGLRAYRDARDEVSKR